MSRSRDEAKFQADVKEVLGNFYPGCIILENDPAKRQGIPDLIILWGPHWAALECKDSASAPYQPNQEWYLEKMNGMSFAATVYPENVEEVLNALQRSFGYS